MDQTIKEVTEILKSHIKTNDKNGLILSYQDLCRKIKSKKFDLENPGHRSEIGHILGQVSLNENKLGNGMLSVIVTKKNGDHLPGNGFFKFAKTLGYDFKDPVDFWIKQLNHVYDSNKRS